MQLTRNALYDRAKQRPGQPCSPGGPCSMRMAGPCGCVCQCWAHLATALHPPDREGGGGGIRRTNRRGYVCAPAGRCSMCMVLRAHTLRARARGDAGPGGQGSTRWGMRVWVMLN